MSSEDRIQAAKFPEYVIGLGLVALRMVKKEWEPTNLFDVFGDSLARQILVIASERPVAAKELAEQLHVSTPTIYRRLNALTEYDLLKERQEIEFAGSNYQSYETTLKAITFEIEEGGYNISIQLRQSLRDQFEAFWSDMERSQPQGTTEGNKQRDRDSLGKDTNHG